MTAGATPEDFRQLLDHRRAEALRALGEEVGRKQAQASMRGTTNSSMTVLALLKAGEEVWRRLVDAMVADLGRYGRSTGLPRDDLVAIACQVMDNALPEMRSATRVDAYASRLKNPSVANEVERQWRALSQYRELQLRQFAIGLHEQGENPGMVTYSIVAENINAPIQQGSHGSTQVVNVTSNELFARLTNVTDDGVEDEATKQQLIELVREMEKKQGTGDYLGSYRQFIEAAANHVTIFAPFLGALAKLIPG